MVEQGRERDSGSPNVIMVDVVVEVARKEKNIYLKTFGHAIRLWYETPKNLQLKYKT